MFFAGLYARGRGDPDHGDEGDKAEGDVGVLVGKRDCHEIDEERKPVLALDCGVLSLELVRVAQTAADGQAQEKKAEARDDHRSDIEGDREGVHLLVQDIRGEKGQQREAEEKAEVGVEDELVGLVGAVDEVVMIYPVNAGEMRRR